MSHEGEGEDSSSDHGRWRARRRHVAGSSCTRGLAALGVTGGELARPELATRTDGCLDAVEKEAEASACVFVAYWAVEFARLCQLCG